MKNLFLNILCLLSLIICTTMEGREPSGPMTRRAKAAQARAKKEILPITLQFEKVPEIQGIQLSLPCYKIKVQNGRPGMTYHLLSQDLSKKYREEGEFIINENGELQHPVDKGSYIAVLQGFQPSEKVRYMIISNDKQQLAETTIIPWPIEKKNAFGHTMTAELINTSYTGFIIHAVGYQPGEPLRILTYVEDKTIQLKGNASREGDFTYLLMPGTKVKTDGGIVTFAIEGMNSTNSIKLPWGTEFRKKGEQFIKANSELFAQLKTKLSPEKL